MTLCAPVFSLKRFQTFGFRRNIYLPAPPPYQKPHFPYFCLPFQVETFTPCLQRRLLIGNPPSCFSASSIQAGNPHPTPILLLLLPHPTCPNRQHDTFHPNHRPLHQISAALSHGACSIARISRSILAAEKQITAARADEVAMAAIRADPQILEDHLAIF